MRWGKVKFGILAESSILTLCLYFAILPKHAQLSFMWSLVTKALTICNLKCFLFIAIKDSSSCFSNTQEPRLCLIETLLKCGRIINSGSLIVRRLCCPHNSATMTSPTAESVMHSSWCFILRFYFPAVPWMLIKKAVSPYVLPLCVYSLKMDVTFSVYWCLTACSIVDWSITDSSEN